MMNNIWHDEKNFIRWQLIDNDSAEELCNKIPNCDFYKYVKSLVDLVKAQSYPNIFITDYKTIKKQLNEGIGWLVILRYKYKKDKKYELADEIRKQLNNLDIQLMDRDNKDKISLLYPLTGKFTSWEMPPFTYSGCWK